MKVTRQILLLEKVVKHFGSQRKLAKSLGLTQQCISYWQIGKQTPSLLYATRIEILTKQKFKAIDLINDDDRAYLLMENDTNAK